MLSIYLYFFYLVLFCFYVILYCSDVKSTGNS